MFFFFQSLRGGDKCFVCLIRLKYYVIFTIVFNF